jgi:general secretion pathway protein H
VRQRGFTLLEMMLILLLIGVSAGMVMLAFPPRATIRGAGAGAL